MPRIAFLGSGNMASAIVDGLLAQKVATAAELVCLGGADDTAANLSARTGIRVAGDLPELCAAADGLLVAFKPQHLASADPRLVELTRGKLVISILAGKKLASLAKAFPHARALVRAMPNTPGRIGAGVTGWCSLAPLADADRKLTMAVLGALGAVHEFPEDMMDAVTAVGGSGPGFVFEFAAALREAAKSVGFSHAQAADFAASVLFGSAKLLKDSGEDPELLRNQVTSPNGTTYAGLRAMEAGKFRDLIRTTITAARDRGRELSKD